jgi:hypothetical protein
MKWFKFYGQDWMTDLKVMNMSMNDRLCLLTLFCLASTENKKGLIPNCDEDSLIRLAHIPNHITDEHNPAEMAKGCLKRYEALQIVTLGRNGDVTVCNFDRRQGQNLSNAERQQNYRKRLKTTTNSRNDSNAGVRNDSNARRDKNRIEEKRERDTESHLAISYLDSIPEEEIASLMTQSSASKSDVLRKAGDLKDYCAAHGKRYKDYRAFLRNAVRRDFPIKSSIAVKNSITIR